MIQPVCEQSLKAQGLLILRVANIPLASVVDKLTCILQLPHTKIISFTVTQPYNINAFGDRVFKMIRSWGSSMVECMSFLDLLPSTQRNI